MLKNLISLIMILMLLFLMTGFFGVNSYVNEHGGVKQTIIHIGKEVKDIGREIGKD
ncbi:hypothetical protein MNBD_GAMMA08-9 [hydrothermal vent metagenome]|uniref:Uncharacterized protein n=1 Tax=hydrothermal vent metagenome TaxID=652676 RepID=A0A3B0X7Z7_9ZZZZ